MNERLYAGEAVKAGITAISSERSYDKYGTRQIFDTRPGDKKKNINVIAIMSGRTWKNSVP